MARNRRQARELALTALYEMEIGKAPLEEVMAERLEMSKLTPELNAFAEAVVRGVLSERESLDKQLSLLVADRSMDRIVPVDRTILRMGAYELFFRDEIPPKVTINEAVELAKKYSAAESGKFVNGVLGRLVEQSPKKRWDPARAAIVEEPAPPEPEPVEQELTEESPEVEELHRVGLWKIRGSEEDDT